jgi:hypothetical protein
VATILTILVLPAGYALFFGKEPKVKTGGRDEHANTNDQEAEDRHPPALAAE